MRLNKVGYLIKEGFLSIFAHGFMSFASITIIIACLIIMGSFALLAINIDAIIGEAESDNEIVAFVNDAAGEDVARAIKMQIDSIENVNESVFVTRDEAMQNYISQFENSRLFTEIESSVFRHRYVIYLNDITKMEQTVTDLEKIPDIARVRADIEISRGFITVRNIVSAVSLVLVVILVIISIFIMSNTIKLTTFGRREEIAIMKMVGANNGFIRWPFVVEGLVLGSVGAGLAYLIQWGIYTLVSEKVMQSIAGGFVDVVPFTLIMQPLLIIFLSIGVAVGAFGGIIAIRNYLKV